MEITVLNKLLPPFESLDSLLNDTMLQMHPKLQITNRCVHCRVLLSALSRILPITGLLKKDPPDPFSRLRRRRRVLLSALSRILPITGLLKKDPPDPFSRLRRRRRSSPFIMQSKERGFPPLFALAHPAGLEPTALCSGGIRSIRVSYGCMARDLL